MPTPPNEPGIGPPATERGRAVGRERRGLAIRDRVRPHQRSNGQTRRHGCAGVAGPCRLSTREDGRFRFVPREPHRPLERIAGSSEAPNTRAAPQHTPRG